MYIKNIICVLDLNAAETDTVFSGAFFYFIPAACQNDVHAKLADCSRAALYHFERSVISSESINNYPHIQSSLFRS